MKRYALTALIFTLCASAQAREADLTATQDRSNGFCTMDVLRLERLPSATQSLSAQQKAFLDQSVERALNLYLAYTGGYTEAPRSELVVAKKAVKWGGRRNNPTLEGAIISVHHNADEDLVTFYFTAEEGKPLLKMALHDEQSATAYWVCEVR